MCMSLEKSHNTVSVKTLHTLENRYPWKLLTSLLVSRRVTLLIIFAFFALKFWEDQTSLHMLAPKSHLVELSQHLVCLVLSNYNSFSNIHLMSIKANKFNTRVNG